MIHTHVLVDPADLGRMPHVFTLKALTYWRGQGVDVRVHQGEAIPLWAGLTHTHRPNPVPISSRGSGSTVGCGVG
jgi:hypothetical protein